MADRLRVATRKGLFTVQRAGGGWRLRGPDFLGDNCSAMLVHPADGTIYVALDHGHFGVKLHRTVAGSNRFEEVAVPEYPPVPDGEAPWTDMFGRPVPDTLKLVWCLEAADPSTPGSLWCGTVPGALFRSADGGESWARVDSLWNDPLRRNWNGGGMDWPGIHTVCVHPDDPRDVQVAVSCGGVWRTRDGGERWTCDASGWRSDYMPPEKVAEPSIQDVHRIARCRARPQTIWAQHHNGIFRSTDDGASWTEITDVEPSVFGFAVAVHPDDPDTAWFVPGIKDERRIPAEGRVVVTRTRDGGETFRILGKGLPGHQAWDLVYRHGLDVDAEGRCLAMGSTTGSLWISEDGGDAWQAISAHLPPVYAVRFDP